MPKTKNDYPWWPYVRNMIRRYPDRKEEFDELHRQNIVPGGDGMPHGSDVGRTVENLAIREMNPVKQKEFDAVRLALEECTSIERKLIELTYWSYRRYYLYGAAQVLCLSERTAKRVHKRFILRVAEYYGFL